MDREIASDFVLGDAEDLPRARSVAARTRSVPCGCAVSMEPKFHDGELIFVDPQVAPVSGRYVVVRLEGLPGSDLQTADHRRRSSVPEGAGIRTG